jgi:hypothetical protein
MATSSSAMPLALHHRLGLMEKQVKRLVELARFLPFADQEDEMKRLANDVCVTASA